MPQEIDVLVSEVGPRDGLQSIDRTMRTEAKLHWIKALAASGLREIEVGSFVSPRLLPQMADCAVLVREANKLEGLSALALVPNLKGAQNAIAAGARKLTMPPSASRAHSLSNIGKTPEEAIEEVRRVCVYIDSLPDEQRPDVEIGISTAFGCTLEGVVSEDWVIKMAGLLAEAGADSIGLSGYDWLCQPGPDQTHVPPSEQRDWCGESGGCASSQYAGPGARQRRCGPRGRREHISTPRLADWEAVPMRREQLATL